MILVDTGPIVALIHADDRYHKRCRDELKTFTGPLASVWPVITEAVYLLGFSWTAQDAVWEMVESEALSLLPLDYADAPRMRELMKKYNDLPMDLADAALVRVAEREKIRRIFTLDRRDFSSYRPLHISRFDILP